MFAELRLRTGTNWSQYTILRTYKDLSFDSKYLDVGAFSFTMPQELVDSLAVKDQSVLEIAPNGVAGFNMWYAVDGTSGTKTADDQVWRTLSGKSIVNWLTDCVVYPSSWPVVPKYAADGTITPIIAGHMFQNATPGNILQTLITRGVQRGGLAWLDASTFTGTTTSDGVAWGATLTNTYTTGTTLLQVLQDLASRRLIQFRMNGMQLQVFNYDTQIRHFTPEQVIFQRGKNILEQNSNTDSSQAGGVILIQGDQIAIREVVDSSLTAAVGRRRERFVAQGGITDNVTLDMLGSAELTIAGHIKTEDSLGVRDDSGAQPWINYDVGDWVWEDVDGTLKNIQIKQIAASGQDANNLKVGLTLGDLLSDNDLKLQQRVDNITGANSSGYGALPNTVNNYLAPAAPVSLAATPTAYRDSNGIDMCQITLTWVPVTTNVDGSVLSDLARYEIQYKIGSSNWSITNNVIPTMSVGYFSNIPSGSVFMAQVRAVDNDGNASAWVQLPSTIILPKYTTAPPTPATPVASTALRGINVAWSGLDNTGATYDAAWLRCDVHVGTSPTFITSPTTLQTSFTTRGGVVNVGGLTYGTTYYIKLIAVDKSGNVSAPSAVSGGASPGQLSDPDLPAKLITGAKIADGAINTTQLTVAAFGDSVVPNGGFEDLNAATTTGAAHWKSSFVNTGAGTTITTATSGGATGTNCLQVVVPVSGAGLAAWVASADDIPTAAGDLWYVKGKIKATRAQATQCAIYLAFGQPGGGNLPLILDGNNPVLTVVSLTPGTAWTEFEGQVLVPSGTTPNPLTRMCVVLASVSDGAANTFFWDDIAVAPIRGSAYIKDASIVNAKINNMSVDKLTAGTLNADVVVSSRIKTSDTGARVELNSTGIHVYDAAGNQNFFADDSNGQVTMTGTLQSGAVHGGEVVVPDPSVAAAAHVNLNQYGLSVNTSPVTNLVPNPNFQNATPLAGVGLGSGVSAAFSRGPAVTDFAGNTDLTPLYGNGCLKVWRAAGASQFTIELGTLQPSTTYTVSWHAATTNINDAPTLTGGYGDWGAVQVRRSSDGNVASVGRDGYILLPTTTFPGVYNIPLSSGLDLIANAGWQMRFFKTFTTPASWAANTAAQLLLPTIVNSDGSPNATLALCISGVQLEQSSYLSRYTDGDQPGCSWAGTVGASSSNRLGQPSVWFPSMGDPYVQGNQSMPQATVRKLKRGTGALQGSNFCWLGLNTQALPTATWTDINWASAANSDRIAQDDGLIRPFDSSRFWAQTAGMFVVTATVVFATGSASGRGLRLVRNDGSVLAIAPFAAAVSTTAPVSLSVSWAGALSVGQWVKVQAYQSSGANLNVLGTGALGGGGDTAQTISNMGFVQVA